MGKPKQVSTQDVQYQEWKPSSTPDLEALRSFQDNPEGLEPALQSQFDRASQRSANRLSSSYNQNIPQTARVAMQQQQDRDLNADYGANLQQSAYDANKMKLGRRMALAEMTIGRPLANKTTETSQQKGGFWGSLAQGALGAGLSFL